MEDNGEEIPKAILENVKKEKDTDIITLVDVDFSEYRKNMIIELLRKIVEFHIG